jgi:hypothetical protein
MTLPLRCRQAGSGFTAAAVLALGMAVAGPSGPATIGGTVSAQETSPCALLTPDEIQPLAPNASIGEGVSSAIPSFSSACRYAWGTGTRRFKLGIIVHDASRMFPGMTPDQIKQRLLASVKPDTDEAVISDVGDAAVFRADSPYYTSATAFVKGRILEVQLDGLAALERKDEAIALLKSAAGRL